MEKHVILHDLRLRGIAPYADLNLSVTNANTLRSAMEDIRRFALNQPGAVTLDIMCHGYETHTDSVAQQSLSDSFGGGGLQLCHEGLNARNVGVTEILKDVVSVITVYACSAAETHSGYENTSSDGQRLFSEMSCYTNATIYAADATQWYQHTTVAMPNASSSVIDFKRFEGNLYQFSPDGTIVVVESNQLAPII